MKNVSDASGPIGFPGMTKEKLLAALAPVFDPLVENLSATPPADMSALSERRGLYLLSERGKYLYVGITGNLRRRWQQHRVRARKQRHVCDPVGAKEDRPHCEIQFIGRPEGAA